MFHIRLIIFWYIFITILTVVSSITIKFIDFLPGLLLLWSLFFVFIIGTKLKFKTALQNELTKMRFCKSVNWVYILISVSFILFFPLYIKYYTGKTILLVLINLFSGYSNYISYQEYFANSDLAVFSVVKLPYIIGAGILKFLFISCCCRLIGFKKNRNFIEILSIIIMSLVIIMLAVSRGTSFEFFELLILLIFTILLRGRRLHFVNWFDKKTMLLVSIVGVLLLLVFSYNIDSRGAGELKCATKDLCFDETGLLTQLSPILGNISYKLSYYFVFGVYLLSKSLIFINFSSIAGITALFIPFGPAILGIGSNYATIACENIIDCSVAWIPDLLVILNNFGILGTIFLVFVIGAFSKNLFVKAVNGSIQASALLYFVFLFMVSLPVGNFITSNSSNFIAIVVSMILFIRPSLGRLFFGLFNTEEGTEDLNKKIK